MKKTKKNIIAYFLFLIYIFVFSINIYAMSGFDENRECECSILYKYEDIALKSVKFDIYKIGIWDNKENRFKISDSFKDYPLDINNMDENDWNKTALAIMNYVKKNNIKSYSSYKTDESGLINIKLKNGIYLVVAEDCVEGKYIYSTLPFFMFVPVHQIETDTWIYELKSEPKIEKYERDSIIDKKVIKVWRDSGHESERQNSIEVELIADGVVKDLVSLNKDNNWRYTWKNLDANKSWSVSEKNLNSDKYSVAIKEDDNTFIIENSYRHRSSGGGSSGGSNHSSHPKIIQEDFKIVKSNYKVDEDLISIEENIVKLPQTGQNWRIVYGFILLGIISIICGFLIEWKGDK